MLVVPQWRRSFRAYDTDVVSATAADTLSPTPPPPVTAAREAAPGRRTRRAHERQGTRHPGQVHRPAEQRSLHFRKARRPACPAVGGEHYEDANGTERTRWHEVRATTTDSDAVKQLAEQGTPRRGA